ncbi:Vacuolar protein sorting-associated protein VTA1-like protein [Armadillidium nasatum]|uniref:Vacuolar protein sorting-associated protein VTA1-like protein n=1 Tax=Armadillidium nasatum TaxID=96803 RepID=A0A5N5SV54_9CRUS|nr:Vacuolar protein sorting-associated protein VTA1-like protein [Armadillidium nasatum]
MKFIIETIFSARLYALQSALKIDKKSPEAKALLISLMDWLETFKKNNDKNESVTSDVAGQAVVENEAHKVFTKADSDDRASVFNKNVVKMFYTAGVLFDIIEVFGELTEEIAAQRKYAKWKATYIHKCLKSGETPVPGPVGSEYMFEFGTGNQDYETENTNNPSISVLPPISKPDDVVGFSGLDNNTYSHPQTSQSINNSDLPSNPEVRPSPAPTSATGVILTPECYSKAQKYCKYASSSMDYEDSATAIGYLTKALNLLTLGREN